MKQGLMKQISQNCIKKMSLDFFVAIEQCVLHSGCVQRQVQIEEIIFPTCNVRKNKILVTGLADCLHAFNKLRVFMYIS